MRKPRYKAVVKPTPYGYELDLYKRLLWMWAWEAGRPPMHPKYDPMEQLDEALNGWREIYGDNLIVKDCRENESKHDHRLQRDTFDDIGEAEADCISKAIADYYETIPSAGTERINHSFAELDLKMEELRAELDSASLSNLIETVRELIGKVERIAITVDDLAGTIHSDYNHK